MNKVMKEDTLEFLHSSIFYIHQLQSQFEFFIKNYSTPSIFNRIEFYIKLLIRLLMNLC